MKFNNETSVELGDKSKVRKWGFNLIVISALNLASISNLARAEALNPDDKNFLRKVSENLNVQVSLTSVAGVLTSNGKLDVTQQSLGLTLTNQDRLLLDVVRSNVGKKAGFDIRKGFLVQVDFKGSVSPLIVRDQTEDDAIQQVDELTTQEALKRRDAAYLEAPKIVEDLLRNAVTAKVNGSPAAGFLTLDQKNQLINNTVTTQLPGALAAKLPLVRAAIDNRFKALLPDAKKQVEEEHVYSRTDQIVKETAIQKAKVTLAIPLNVFANVDTEAGTAPVLALMSIGKDSPELGADLESNGLSKWENIVGHSNEGERGNTVFATGYASVGVAYAMSKSTVLTLKLIGYHDRDPWISAQQFVAHSYAIATEVFDRYQNFADLDSAGVRIGAEVKLKSLKGSFWGTLVKRSISNPGNESVGYSFGGTISTDKKKATTLNFAYAHSGKAYYNQTFSVGVAQTVFDKKVNSWKPGLILYTDLRGVKHLLDPENSASGAAGEKKYVAMGSHVDICKYMSPKLQMNCALVGEYQRTIQKNGPIFSSQADDDFYVGMMADAVFDF